MGGSNGQTEMYANGAYIDGFSWKIDNNAKIGFKISLNPSSENKTWDWRTKSGGCTTGDCEVSHIFKSVIDLMTKKSGDNMEVNQAQDKFIGHSFKSSPKRFYDQLINILKAKGEDTSKIKPDEINKDNVLDHVYIFDSQKEE